MTTLRLATRSSALALSQSRTIAARIEAELGFDVELVTFKTSGDRLQDVSLAKVGGKGLFVKELEEALLDGRADIAVHSAKDLPAQVRDHLPKHAQEISQGKPVRRLRPSVTARGSGPAAYVASRSCSRTAPISKSSPCAGTCRRESRSSSPKTSTR